MKEHAEYIQNLMDQGAAAVTTAVFSRDLVIAKLMNKLGVKEINLHIADDPPSMQQPFGIAFETDESNEVLIVRLRSLNDKMN